MTYYTWNRYFLLSFALLSFIVPFINVSAFVEPRQLHSISFVNEIPSIHSHLQTEQLEPTAYAFTYFELLAAVFLLVSFFLFVRLFVQLLSIARIRSKAVLLHEGEVKLYHMSSPALPFSFLSSIFVNKNNYSADELQKIVDHETVHVQQKHTIDVLITEVICILNWYNPFAWLIKKAVRENLEFIADEAVIRKGIDKKNYQYLLLKVTGNIPSSIVSTFKFSSLKNRIVMMNTSKTSRFHLFKFVLLVPMIMLLLLAFRNRKEMTENMQEDKTVATEVFTLSKLTYSIPDNTIKNIVFKEQDKSVLKAGEVFSLAVVSDEKIRLQNLLEKNGFSNLNSSAITFLIDSSSAHKSFSVQVNINLPGAGGFVPAEKPGSINSQRNTSDEQRTSSIKKSNKLESSTFNKRWKAPVIATFLKGSNTHEPC
jgi:small-conductance mechanosensitive channel